MTTELYLDTSLARGAAAAARRLRAVCAGWPDDRFGELAYGAALARIKDELPRQQYEAARRLYEARRGDFLARLRGRSD